MPSKVSNINELSFESVECRAFRHWWGPYTANPANKGRYKGWSVTLVCKRCGKVYKHFMLSVRGKYGKPRYTYLDDYLMDHTPDEDEKSQINLQAIGDLLPAGKVIPIKRKKTS